MKFSRLPIVILLSKTILKAMKTSVLLLGFLLFIAKANAQIGIHSVYNPNLFTPKKKSFAIKNKDDFIISKSDTVFVKNSSLFLQYIPKRKVTQTIIFADNSFNLGSVSSYPARNEIDLEKTKNHAKQLFFKMKMWRYFRE